MRPKQSAHVRDAFTLIELLLVMVILGILAAIVVPNFTHRGDDSRLAAARQDISAVATAMGAYEVDNGHYPSTDEGLAALSNPPANATNWKGPYVAKAVINDHWGHSYIYHSPGTHNPRGYDLLSCGPDGQEGGADDIDNWGSVNGL